MRRIVAAWQNLPSPRTQCCRLGPPAGHRSSLLQPGHSGHSCPAPAAAPGSLHSTLEACHLLQEGFLGPCRKPPAQGSQSSRDFTVKPTASRCPNCGLYSRAQLDSPSRPGALAVKEEPPPFYRCKAGAQRWQIMTRVPHAGRATDKGLREVRPSRTTVSASWTVERPGNPSPSQLCNPGRGSEWTCNAQRLTAPYYCVRLANWCSAHLGLLQEYRRL